VTVNSPNGGESYDGGSMQTITWNATDNLGVTTVDIYLSVNGGSTYPFTVATGETNDGTYDWPVERVNSANCLIKVVAHDDALNDGIDESDAAFEINTLILPAMSWPGIVFLLVAVAGVAFLLLLRRRRRT
jgi:hypothetical protein